MTFKLFKKNCEVCGVEVDKKGAIKESDRYFCSEDHAKEYEQKISASKNKRSKGGCC